MHRSFTALPLLFVLLFLSPVFAQAQCEGRYVYELFTDVLEVPDVQYGSAVDYEGNTQDLFVDLYLPADDTLDERPLVVMAHGGFFISGDRTADDMVEICRGLARRGYACASLQYRLGVGTDEIDSVGFSKAVVRGVQDAKGAIRFLRGQHATYGLDTNQVFLGGTSAGGVLAVHYAYLQDTTLLPTWIKTEIDALGGLYGNSGPSGYGDGILAAVSYAGAIKALAWMGNEDIPLASTHGTGDPVVPYGYGQVTYVIIPGVLEVPITPMYGSERIHAELDLRGVDNEFWSVDEPIHVPHLDPGTFGLDAVRFPQTVQWTAEFLHRQLDCYDPTGFAVPALEPISVHPVPASGTVVLEGLGQGPFTALLYDGQGRLLGARHLNGSDAARWARKGLPAGTYFLDLQGADGRRYRATLVYR